MNKLRTPILSAAFFLWGGMLICSASSTAETGRSSGTPAEGLPKALMGLDVKDHFILSGFKKAGAIEALKGHVVVVHKATRQAYFGKDGDPLFENDTIHTLAQSRCRIRFSNGDIVSMAPESEFSVETYDDRLDQGKKTTLLGMLGGKVKFYTLRLLRYKETRFAVKTPTAVVGVRGTKFGIHVYWDDADNAASRAVLLADRGDGVPLNLVEAERDRGGKSRMVVHAMEGDVDVDGKALPEGFSYKDGEIDPSDPDEVDDFDRATDVNGASAPEQGAGDKPMDPLGREGDAGDKGNDDQAVEADSREHPADIQIEENANDVVGGEGTGGSEPGGGGGEVVMGTRGYFSAMLTENIEGSPSLYGHFVSSSLVDLSGVVTIPGVADPDDYINVSAVSAVKEINLNGQEWNSGDLGNAHPIVRTVMGSNAYLEWGYWTMTVPVEKNAFSSLEVDNRAYYIMGNPTPDATINGLAGQVNYLGSAWGTYYSTAGGENMSGSFNCTVDFTADTVSNFNMTVDNSGVGAAFRQARIIGGGGNLAGGQFTLNPGIGAWDLQSTAAAGPNVADEKAGAGAIYGPAAQAVGGVWGMKHTPSGDAAVGGFQGTPLIVEP
jgi:hypothetical protein